MPPHPLSRNNEHSDTRLESMGTAGWTITVKPSDDAYVILTVSVDALRAINQPVLCPSYIRV